MEDRSKKSTSVDVIANLPRRDGYSPEHGSENPHLEPGELCTLKAWREHKPAKQLKPKKQA